MSKELPSLKPKQVIVALERAGFVAKRQTGSHVIFYKPDIRHPITVPNHTSDLPTGTLRAIIRQANLTVDEFISLLS
jgi:predicted RNA binding protein YcfA (HicA-like mRNA interferase family)